MANLFNIPQNYNGADLFSSLDDLRQFANDHEEELEDLHKFDICFDTDEWAESISSKGYTLDSMLDTMETENYSYFEDVKAQHGTAALVYYHNDERINLYSITY